MKAEKLHRFLPGAKATCGRRYFKRRREPIPGRRSIHERPEAVEDQVVRDWLERVSVKTTGGAQ